jgi:hypothetical protein
MLTVPEKKNFLIFFNITSIGKKLILKNRLTPAPPPFLLRFGLKIYKNEGMILGKFQNGSRLGTWCSTKVPWWCRTLPFSLKQHHLRPTISNFSTFLVI